MWFKKKNNDEEKKLNRLDRIEERIDNIKKEHCEKEEKLSKEIEKLHRIIKFTGDEPTFNLDRGYDGGWFTTSIKYKNTLYIYYEKEEYITELMELGGKETDKDSYEFRVERDLAYFNISSRNNDTWTRHEYVIDFKKGSYVCNTCIDEERTAKEKERIGESVITIKS